MHSIRLSPFRNVVAVLALSAATTAGTAGTAPIDLSPVPARDPGTRLKSGWQHGAFIEIFVRAWRDSDGDGFGDLRGLTQTLDYLHELGVSGIWLMPVTRSADNDHGYAVADFRAIEPAYGTLADFDELLRQAHARGIGVIMDYVVNHSAASHPLFAESRQGPGNAFRDWYVWQHDAPDGWDIWGKNPWYHGASEPWLFKGDPAQRPPNAPDAKDFYFATFGPHMPDFNLRNPTVLEYHRSSLRFWLNRGLDGYRLDAVPHLIENDAAHWNDQPESRRLTRQLRRLVTAYPRRYVVCEATAAPLAYGDAGLCGGAFAFGYVQHFVGAAQGKAESVRALADYYRTTTPGMATFVSNHDIFAGRRLWDQVAGDVARYKLAAAGYLLQPGTPFIYYGEEIGQAGVPDLPGDQPLRAPMSWSADPVGAGFTSGVPFRPVAPNAAIDNVETERADPASMLAFYKSMIGLRNRYPSIARGSFEAATADGLVLTFQRRWRGERTLVAINYGTQPATLRVDALPPRARLVPAYPAAAARVAADRAGSAQLDLAPQSVRVFVVRR